MGACVYKVLTKEYSELGMVAYAQFWDRKSYPGLRPGLQNDIPILWFFRPDIHQNLLKMIAFLDYMLSYHIQVLWLLMNIHRCEELCVASISPGSSFNRVVGTKTNFICENYLLFLKLGKVTHTCNPGMFHTGQEDQ